MNVKRDKLHAQIATQLKNCGFSSEEIASTLTSWKYASDSEKPSHGYDRFSWLLEIVKQGTIVPNSKIAISNSGIYSKLLGTKSLGYLAADLAVGEVIRSARKFNIGIGTVTDCYPTGCMGQYVERITEEGYIGVAISHSPPRVSAFGTADKVFGTMGHSFGFPGTTIPYIYDGSVGALTNGDVMLMHKLQKRLPRAAVFSSKGTFTRDPNDVVDMNEKFTGIISIAGGRSQHKMSGLAGSLELFCRLALVDSDSSTSVSSYSYFMAIDPAMFGSAERFKEQVSDLQRSVTSAKRKHGTKRVHFAGEQSYHHRCQNSAKQSVEISEQTYLSLFHT